MIRNFFPTSLLLLIFAWGCNQSTGGSPGYTDETTLNFNKNWEFTRDIDTTAVADYFERGSQAEWEEISLPHTAHIEPLVISDQQWQGTAFYRKFFELTPEDSSKYVALKIGAAMHEADIYLNGEKILKHKGGYLPFVIDISGKADFSGENVLLIKLNNEDNPTIPPGKPIANLDFNYFSGLYRNAFLLKDDKLHISDPIAADRVAAGGILVHYSGVSESSATVHVQTDVSNFYDSDQNGSVRIVLKDENGEIVAERVSGIQSISAGSSALFQQEFEVSDPDLWSPDHPYRYTLTAELSNDGEIVDTKQVRIGIRTFSFDDDNAFVLNGEKLKLRGTNRHQSYPYIGYALSDNAQYRDAYKIKQAGFNFIRTAHYPPSKAFLEACDELGILFMNAIPGWQFFGDEEFQHLSHQNIREMIRRDRNHPSIVIWEASLNESGMDESFMDRAHQIVKEELPFDDVYTSGWRDYAYDIFIPARQHSQPPAYWNEYSKDKPLFIAEYGDWEYYAQNAGFNQDQFEDLEEEERNSRQLRGDGQKRLAQQALNFQEAHNSNLQGPAFGNANWVMFDYNRGYAPNLEASGIRDIFRIPKFAYYFYQSQDGPNLDEDAAFGKPMIFIANYWHDPDYKTVKVYSNTDEVELFLNNNSQGRQRPDSNRVSTHLDHPPFTFKPENFEPGMLRAVGYIDGKEVVEATRTTPGQPSGIELEVDYSGKPLAAGEKDVVFVYANIVDEDGVTVPDATHPIQFSVEGDADLIGQNPIYAEAGTAMILLRAGRSVGEIVIHANVENFGSNHIQIKSK